MNEVSISRSREVSPWRSPQASESQDSSYAYNAEGQPHLRDYWNVLLKHRSCFALTVVMVCLVGFYINLTATALYTSSATLQIEPQNPTVTGVSEMYPLPPNSAGGPYDYYQTQFVLLRSRDLAVKVVEDLGLASDNAFKNMRVVTANPLQRIQSSLVALVSTLISYVKPIGKQITEVPTSDVNSVIIDRYSSLVKIKPVRNTRLVEIYATTPDPPLSHKLANAHARTFIRKNLETRFSLTKEAREFLEIKNNELKAKLERSEQALNRFRQRHGVVSMEKGENIVVDRLAEINKELTRAQGERIAAESLHKTVQNKNLQFLSQIVNNVIVQNLKTNLNNLESERARFSTIFKPDHPRIKELTEQIDQARDALKLEIANVVRGIEANYVAARAKEDALQAAAQKQQQAALNLQTVGVEYAVLLEEVNINRAVYQGLLKRLNETDVSNDLAAANMRIVVNAETATSSSMPNTPLNLALTIVFALFLGVGVVFFADYVDARVSTPEVVGRVMALSTLGVVPHLNSLKQRRTVSRYPSHAESALKRVPQPDLLEKSRVAKEQLMVVNEPLSILGEFYRAIRTALLYSRQEGFPKVLLLTSPSPGEGKTITTLNLGIALAQEGHRVLIIDADLRKGCCHERLGITNHKGLSNVLNGTLRFDEAVRSTAFDGLSLVSCGTYPRNPCDLLGSSTMRHILSQARETFNFVLIDSPPALPLSDAAVLSTMSDGVVLVLHAQRTSTPYARSVRDRLDAVHAPILGVILNGIDLGHPSYAGYRRYYGSGYGSLAHEAEYVDEGSAEILTGRERSDIQVCEEAQPGIVSSEVFERMIAELTKAVGPIAPVMFHAEIGLLKESADSFPMSKLKNLVRQLCHEIPDERLRKSFEETMELEIRSL